MRAVTSIIVRVCRNGTVGAAYANITSLLGASFEQQIIWFCLVTVSTALFFDIEFVGSKS